jgi:hypothetical protein
LKISITVAQAEIQESRNEAFYLDSVPPEVTPAGRHRESAHSRAMSKNARQHISSPRTPSLVQQPCSTQVTTGNARSDVPRNAMSVADMVTSQEIVQGIMRKQTANPNNPAGKGGSKVKPLRAKEPKPQCAPKRVIGRKVRTQSEH